MAFVRCDNCDDEADACLCRGCEGSEEDKSRTAAGTSVRDWADRQKALGRLSPELLAEFERCAEDLEVGDG